MIKNVEDDVVYELTRFANEFLYLWGFDTLLWLQGQDYKGGDAVYGSLKGVYNKEKFQCRPDPYGYMCSESSPIGVD